MTVDLAKIDTSECEVYNQSTHHSLWLKNYLTANPIESVFDLEEDPTLMLEAPSQFVHLVAEQDASTTVSIEVDLAKAWHSKFRN